MQEIISITTNQKRRMTSTLKSFAIAATLLVGFALSSCNRSKQFAAYQCPMNCQTDTAYTNAGKCPVCEMDLEGVEKIDSTKIKIINNSKNN